MIKFFFIWIFMFIMLGCEGLRIFFYNLCFFIRFIIIFYIIIGRVDFCIVRFNFGVDYYSVIIIILTCWIIGLIFICLNKDEVKYSVFIFILVVLVGGFRSINLILFYLFFEIRLIPIFVIIINWGGNMERLEASYYILIYTLFISLPLLLYILELGKNFSRLDFRILIKFRYVEIRIFRYFIYLMALLIKIPIYFFHVWLPKAHVEAPVYGSMILAAVLLKLGGYGLIRVLIVFLLRGLIYGYIIFSISMIGGILVRLSTLVQIDIKRLVAYSSVVHINFIICSIITLFKTGFIGGYLMIVAHGLCSSGLFYIVMVMYNRSNSRLLIINKGIITFISSMIIFWAYLCVRNFSFPLRLNFLGEIVIIMRVIMWEKKIFVLMIVLGFFSRAYSLYLFSYVMHGGVNIWLKFNRGEILEYVVLIVHCYPIIIIIIKLNV